MRNKIDSKRSKSIYNLISFNDVELQFVLSIVNDFMLKYIDISILDQYIIFTKPTNIISQCLWIAGKREKSPWTSTTTSLVFL